MKLKDIKPGDTIAWEEVTDPHRGYIRHHRITVASKRGHNIETTGGDWLWWANISRWDPTKVEA